MRLRPLLLLTLLCGLLPGQDPALRESFLQAKALWSTSGNRDEASARFEAVVTALAPQAATLDREWRQLLAESYNWLAVLEDRNPQTRSKCQGRLQALLDLNPDFELDRTLTSQRLQSLYERLRAEAYAPLRLSFVPEGGQLTLDGRPSPAVALRHLPFGRHTLAYARPGFAPSEQVVDLLPKDAKTLAFKLTRTSSTLTLYVHPQEAEILLDGRPLGRSQGHAGPDAAALAAPLGLRAEDLSAPFIVGELSPGKHNLEVRAGCHRPKTLVIGEELATPPADHTLEPIRLEPSRGTLTVTSSWPGGELLLSGRSLGPLPVDGATVCAGTYDLLVRFPGGGYAQPLTLPEGQSVRLEVQPKPRLAYLGLEGGEFTGRARFQTQLEALGSQLTHLVFLRPQAQESPADALQRLKTSREAELVLTARPLPDPVIHRVELVLATLDGEEERLVVKPLEMDPLASLVARLNRMPPLDQPGLGLRLLDLPGEPGPWVLDATERARTAGIQVGRPLLSLNGKPLATAHELAQALIAGPERACLTQEGATVTLPVAREAVEVPLGAPQYCYPAVLAQLRLRYAGAKGDLANLIRLDQGLVLMQFRAFGKAIEVLRDARMSTVAGVCQGTLDYYTGVCFLRMGPAYQSEAAQAFRQALKYPQATLLGPDGPLVAPLAKQALDDLK